MTDPLLSEHLEHKRKGGSMLERQYRIAVISMLALAILFVGIMVAASLVQAEERPDPRTLCPKNVAEDVRKGLKETFGEELKTIAIIGKPDGSNIKGVMEMYGSNKGTWTILWIRSDGCAQMVLGGGALTSVAPILAPGDDI